MAIKLKTSMSSINEQLENSINIVISELIRMLTDVGEHCIIEARNAGSYTDRTGNLRSSIGYVVLRDGVVQNMDAKNMKSRQYIEELIPQYSNGLVLIVVAGMNYAKYVEARSYNVLASAELEAEKLVRILLHKLGITIK